jgi:hypothetical protein
MSNIAFTHRPDQVRLRTVNVPMFRTAIEAIDALAPNLEHVILQTGGQVILSRILTCVVLRRRIRGSTRIESSV